MELTVVVVTYNSASIVDATITAVRGAVTHLDAEILVVDDASSDATCAVAERSLGADGLLIRMPVNLGYGAAVNLGAKQARGEYLLMMNDDVLVTRATIDRLLATLRDSPSLAMVGPRLTNPDGSPTSTMYRWVPGWRYELGRIKHRLTGARWSTSIPEGAEVAEVGVLFAACALVKTEFFRHLGGFNDAFFIYGQDLDFSKRASSANRAVAVDTRVAAIHHQDEAFARRPKGRAFADLVRRARDTYYRIWLPRPSRMALNLLRTIGRDDQPRRLLYHLRRSVYDGPSLRHLRRPPPLSADPKASLDSDV